MWLKVQWQLLSAPPTPLPKHNLKLFTHRLKCKEDLSLILFECVESWVTEDTCPGETGCHVQTWSSCTPLNLERNTVNALAASKLSSDTTPKLQKLGHRLHLSAPHPAWSWRPQLHRLCQLQNCNPALVYMSLPKGKIFRTKKGKENQKLNFH